jgi:hypothetical protein
MPKRELAGIVATGAAILALGLLWTAEPPVRRPRLHDALPAGTCVAAGAAAHAAVLEPEEPEPPPILPMPRERLRFVVESWLGESGEIVAEVGALFLYQHRIPAYPVTIRFKTTDLISKLYICRGNIDLVLDARTMRPLLFEERSRTGLGITGGEKNHRKIVYDRETGTLRYYRILGRTGQLGFRRKRTFPRDSHHFASLAFAARTIDLKMGAELNAVLSDDKEDLPVKATVVRATTYRAPDGEDRAAWILETVDDFGKEEIEDASIWIWVDQEDMHPVRLDANIPLGKITARLVRRTPIQDAAAGPNGGGRNHPGSVSLDSPPRQATPQRDR